MANNNININITASDNATPTIQKIEQAVSNLGKKATASISITGLDAIDKQLASLTSKTASQKLKISTGIDTNATSELKNWGATAVLASTNATNGFKNFEKQLKETGSNIDNIGSRLRYLSLVMSVAFAGAIVLMQKFASSAKEAETSEMKLMVAAQTTGETYEKLTSDAQKLVSATGGMLNLADASEVLSNAQMALGDSEKSYLWALRMVDTAMVKKQNATDSSAEAVKKASLGLLTYREVMYDSAGAEIKLKDAEKEFAKEFNNGNTNLTERQKRLALYNATMKQTEQYAGMAALASTTFSGSLTKMNANVKMMQTNLGNALVPLLGTLAVAVDSTASKISNFSKTHSGLTMAIIAGTIAVTGFLTIVAGAGALVEMLSSSIGSLAKMFSFILNPAILMTIAQITLLVAVIGGLTYAWLKLTNRWDIWKNKMTVLGQRIKNSIDLFKDSANTADDTAKKLQKSIDSLQTSINDATADFNQQMSEWVADHDKNISKLKKQIGELKDEYKESISEITDDWDDAMDDLSLSHERKTEDLQEQIDEEVSKGIWADKTKIKELKKELARENEDYALAQEEKTTAKEEQLDEETEQYDEKLSDYEAQLKEEEDLEEKHSVIISQYRTQPYLDEVEKMLQSRSRQLRDQAEQVASTKEMYASETTAVGGATNAIEELGNMFGEVEELQVRSIQDGIKEWWNAKDEYEKAGLSILGILTSIATALGIGGLVGKAFKSFFISNGAGFASASTGILGVFKNLKLLPKLTIIGIVVETVIALEKIYEVYEAIKGLGKEMNDVFSGQETEGELQNKRIALLKEELKNGTITLEEYKNKLSEINEKNKESTEQTQELINKTNEASLSSVSWIADFGELVDKNFLTPLNKAISWVGENFTLSNIFKGILNIGTWFSTNVSTPFFTTLSAWIGKVVTWFSTNFNWSTLLKTLTNIGTWFSTNIGTPFSSWFTSVKEWFKNNFTWNNLLSGLTSLSDWIKDKTSSITSGTSTTKTSSSSSSGTTKSSSFSSYLSNAVSSAVSSAYKTLAGYSEGGIVSGNIGDETLIRAHGGETVLPYGVSPNNISITINNPSVRSDADIKSIAQAVKDVISREMALKKFS